MAGVDKLKQQIREAQYLSDSIGDDASHPVFDTKHPHHREANQAFQQLQENIELLTIQLDKATRKVGFN